MTDRRCLEVCNAAVITARLTLKKRRLKESVCPSVTKLKKKHTTDIL